MNIAILGTGRIAQALRFYYTQNSIFPPVVTILEGENDIARADLVIGTLPGGLGENSLQAALTYKKDLIDLADMDVDYYLKQKRDIAAAGILVIPACGFCPGLVNFIIGNEAARSPNLGAVDVSAGSLSTKKNFFPFLWCFEDMMLEFLGPSVQIIERQRREYPPFAGYREESIYGIPSESYLSQSGFENLADHLNADRFTYRNIRPLGFKYFFRYLHNHGFLKEAHIQRTKEIMEERFEDNMSIAEIALSSDNRLQNWRIKSFSHKKEPLNSMQKITALFPIAMIHLLVGSKIRNKGLLFCEEIGLNNEVFNETIEFLRKKGVSISRISADR
ncbi:hypothetical protein QUF70_09975 [Desulfobacterales bacterium HSG17]|nr:hypothetical protein [Desulfobacterales bacterium HSG17]